MSSGPAPARAPGGRAPPFATVCACATTRGGRDALLRLGGPATRAVTRRAGLVLPAPWVPHPAAWRLRPGEVPAVLLFAPAGRSFTGSDLLEIVLPGADPVIEAALERLRGAGAAAAGPGAFTRQALLNRRLTLDQAEGILSLARAADAAAARRALDGLKGRLGAAVAAVREELLALRARLEADLDFADDAGIPPLSGPALAAAARALGQRLAGWIRTAGGRGAEPLVCLVGPANAGKSALYNRLAGARALVDARPGTTRDWLERVVDLGGRRLRLADTAGWLAGATGPDAAAIAAGERLGREAALLLALSAPDAPLASDWTPPASVPALVVATKADRDGVPDPRAALAVSAVTGTGLADLRGRIAAALGDVADAEPRQQELLGAARAGLERLAGRAVADELAAEELREIDRRLADLVGHGTPEEILDRIFAAFCIGK